MLVERILTVNGWSASYHFVELGRMVMRKVDKNISALESASLFSDSYLPSV